jgi:spore coat polysaccharide biosynthesis predicted glycosyltransferase SpsG
VVVDSYHFDAAFLAALAPRVSRLVVIDDFNAHDRYTCDAILNFTVGAETRAYTTSARALWLGPRFFLARRPLRASRAAGRAWRGGAERVLLSFGGADRGVVASLALDTLLLAAPGSAVKLVAGGETPPSLAERVHAFGGELLRGLADLSAPFAWADAAISGGGLTKYEAAYLGVPTAVLSQTREQAEETRRFAAAGLAFDLGIAGARAPAELAPELARFLSDEPLRRSLRETGLGSFGDDPTRAAAHALLGLLKERR